MKQAETEGAVTSADSCLNWGRGGQVEANTGLGDTPTLPAGSGFSSIGVEQFRATPPSDFGRPVKPNASNNQSWNMSDICDYKIGG
jgi:hypothetical protein